MAESIALNRGVASVAAAKIGAAVAEEAVGTSLLARLMSRSAVGKVLTVAALGGVIYAIYDYVSYTHGDPVAYQISYTIPATPVYVDSVGTGVIPANVVCSALGKPGDTFKQDLGRNSDDRIYVHAFANVSIGAGIDIGGLTPVGCGYSGVIRNLVEDVYYVHIPKNWRPGQKWNQNYFDEVEVKPRIGAGTVADPKVVAPVEIPDAAIMDAKVIADDFNALLDQAQTRTDASTDVKAFAPVTAAEVSTVAPETDAAVKAEAAKLVEPKPATIADPDPGTDPETPTDGDGTGGAFPTTGLGDPFSPVRSFISSTFQPFLHPSMTLPAGVRCPVVAIDLPKMLSASVHSNVSREVNSSFVCDWMEGQRPLFLGFLHAVYLLGGIVVVLKRS